MEIDWSKAPEGTTHAVILNGEIHWRRQIDDSLYAYYGTEDWRPVAGGASNFWKGHFTYVEKPELTIRQLRSLVQESGLQIEFHADGTIYVWDGTCEEGTYVNSLEEYIRLAEAKAAYAKLWAGYIWE